MQMTLLLAGSTSGVSGGIVSKVSNGVLCVQNLDHNNMVAKHIKLLDTHFAISCYRHHCWDRSLPFRVVPSLHSTIGDLCSYA